MRLLLTSSVLAMKPMTDAEHVKQSQLFDKFLHAWSDLMEEGNHLQKEIETQNKQEQIEHVNKSREQEEDSWTGKWSWFGDETQEKIKIFEEEEKKLKEAEKKRAQQEELNDNKKLDMDEWDTRSEEFEQAIPKDSDETCVNESLCEIYKMQMTKDEICQDSWTSEACKKLCGTCKPKIAQESDKYVELTEKKETCKCTDEMYDFYGRCNGLLWDGLQLCYVENRANCPEAQYDFRNQRWWSFSACDEVNAPLAPEPTKPVNTECTCTELRNSIYGTCGGLEYFGQVLCYVENPDYCSDAQYDAQVDAYYSFVACPENVKCKCDNGVPTTGNECPFGADYENCSSCHSGYELTEWMLCKPVKNDKSTTCDEWVCSEGLIRDEDFGMGDCLLEQCDDDCCKKKEITAKTGDIKEDEESPDWYTKISNKLNGVSEKFEDMTEDASEGWSNFSDHLSEKWDELKELSENVSDQVDDWFCTCNNDVHDGYGNCQGELHNEKYICYVKNPKSQACQNYHIFYDFDADQFYTHELCTQTEEVKAPFPEVTEEKIPAVLEKENEELLTCWEHECEGMMKYEVGYEEECGSSAEECEAFCCDAIEEQPKEEKVIRTIEEQPKEEKVIPKLTCWEHECDGMMNFEVGFEDECGWSAEECEAFCCVKETEEPKEEKVIPENKSEEISEDEELDIEEQTESPEIKRTEDEDCWTKCDEKNGKCDWCGPSGKCCRKGHAGGGCNGQEGPEDRHICVYAPANEPLDCTNTDELVLGYTCDQWKSQASENNRAWNLSSWAKVDGICYDADYGWPKLKILNEKCKKLCQPQVCAPKEPEHDCWAPCNEKNGTCDWCQYGGKCCRKGHEGEGCSGDEGHEDRHICVYDKPIAFLKSDAYRQHRRLMDGLRGSRGESEANRRKLSKV